MKVCMRTEEILRYLYLVDRRLTILTSGASWKPEYGPELETIDRELAELRVLVDQAHEQRAAAGRRCREAAERENTAGEGKTKVKIKWREMAPIRVQLIHEMWLTYEENGQTKSVFSSKDKPVKGTAAMYGYKKIGNNNVEFYYFKPDFKRDGDDGYEISAKWFKKIPTEPTYEASIPLCLTGSIGKKKQHNDVKGG